jgi:hypothetical protein
MLRCTGEIVRFERKPWSKDGRTGVMKTARVLVGRADFVDVDVAEDAPEPREGDQIDWGVTFSVRAGRGNYGPQASVRYRGEWSALVGKPATKLGAVAN